MAEGESSGGLAAIDLRLRFKKGQVFEIKRDLSFTFNHTFMMITYDIDQSFRTDFSLAVTEVDSEGVITAEVTFDRVMFRQDGLAGIIEYDSTAPSEFLHPLVLGYAALKGQSFAVSLKPDGSIRDIDRVDEMLAKITSRLDFSDYMTKEDMARGSDESDTLIGDQIKKSMVNQFGKDGLKVMIESFTAIFPDKPVRIGGSWKKIAMASKDLPVIIDKAFTLRSSSEGISRLESIGNVSPNPDAPAVGLESAQMKIELAGIETGTAEIDEATGMILRYEIKSEELKGSSASLTPPGRCGTIEINSATVVEMNQKATG